jgi:hypothetical protein
VKSQKDAVVQLVKAKLGSNFTEFKDDALAMLTQTQLDEIKREVYEGLINGVISYGKDLSKTSEVLSYARSVTMNHLKKAKELNGNSIRQHATTTSSRTMTTKKLYNGIDMSMLPEDLKNEIKSVL